MYGRKCIVHIPYALDPEAKGAPMLRPRKMIDAFRTLGYEVDVVSGHSGERARLMREIMRKIRRGVRYSFMYAESSTMPTPLTDPDHLPRHPFADFSFFRFLKRNGIKTGLFYRDIYWRFDAYKKDVPCIIKRMLAIVCYKYELKNYDLLLNKLYLVSLKMEKYLGTDAFSGRTEALPPGCEALDVHRKKFVFRDFSKDKLQIFYVGGIGEHYNMDALLEAVGKVEQVELTVCCRAAEWDKESKNFYPYLCERIRIVHERGTELEKYYDSSDICSLMFEHREYREFAVPYKTFEYLAHYKPVLVTAGTGIAEFTEQFGTGWIVENNAESIAAALTHIIHHPEEIDEKVVNCVKARERNTWIARATQVAERLSV